MIETITSMAFLVSSLYGAGQPATAAHAVAIPQAEQAILQNRAEPTTTIAATTTSPLTDNSDIRSYVRAAYADEPLLVDIARCESSFRQYGTDGQALRGKANHADVGVMQINEKYHADQAKKLGYDIYTAEGNVAFAKYLYAKYGTDPWSSSEVCWADSSGLAKN